MAQSAIEGAILNVKINLSAIKDDNYKEGMEKEIKNLSQSGLEKQKEILRIVEENL